MDFSWTDEQEAQYKDLIDFSQSSLCENVVDRDQNCVFSTDLWQRCAERGVLGWSTPESLGGKNYTALHCAYLLEALGYGCNDNGLLFALGTQMWGVQSCLLQFGTDQQQNDYIPEMIQGIKIGAYAINEPESGSDAFAIGTTATEDGDAYILNGEKSLISMSTVADFAIIFAMTDKNAGRWGLSAFIVDTDTPGFKLGKHNNMMGLRTVPFGGITLNQCRVPKTAMLGKPGSGASIFSYSQSWERSLMLAPQVGAMKKQLHDCVNFAKSRKQSTLPISKNQAISHRLVNMRIRIESSELLLYKTAWMLAHKKQNLLEAAITKTHISESFVECSKDAISVFGGTGFLSETGIERSMRDAIGGTIYGGTADIQRNIIAGLLGL